MEQSWDDQVLCQCLARFWKESFFPPEQWVGLKCSVNYVINTINVNGCVVIPALFHLWSLGRVDLAWFSRVLGFKNGTWLQLKVTSCISFQQESACFWNFEARHQLLSSSESPRWHLLLIYGCFVYIAKLVFSGATFMNHPSQIFWITRCSFYISTCCFTLHFYVWRLFLS